MVLTYSVPGISCEHCKSSIEGEVGGLDGVAYVEVDVDAQTVVVEGTVSDEAVQAALGEAGFDERFLLSAEDVGEGLGVDDGEPLGGAGEGDVEGP